MDGHLITLDGGQHDVTKAEIERLRTSSTPFWLDLHSSEGPEVHELLRDAFAFHPLALEDAEKFHQRPKLDTYDDFALLVVYGLGTTGALVEVHCFCTESFFVTVHQEACPPLAEVVRRLQIGTAAAEQHLIMVLYRVVDFLVDGFFPALATLDDRIDELEDEILKAPTEDQLGQLFDLKRSLISLRKVVTPERDVFATLVGDKAIPGMTTESERYFRDVYDHLIRVSDMVDSYRDLLSSALDTHLSTVSNRLNVVMKQLTIIATIFLPMSFITGFFGQNFAWMVGRLTGLGVFLGAGIGLQVMTAVVLVVMFRRRGWLTSQGTVPAPNPARRSSRAGQGGHTHWPGWHSPVVPTERRP